MDYRECLVGGVIASVVGSMSGYDVIAVIVLVSIGAICAWISASRSERE